MPNIKMKPLSLRKISHGKNRPNSTLQPVRLGKSRQIHSTNHLKTAIEHMQDNELVKILKNRQDGDCMDWPVKSMFYVFYASMVQDCRSIETLRAPTQLATHQHSSCPCCQKRQAPARPKLEIRRKFAISQHENPRIKLRIRQCEHFQATADPGKSTISSSISFQRETLGPLIFLAHHSLLHVQFNRFSESRLPQCNSRFPVLRCS